MRNGWNKNITSNEYYDIAQNKYFSWDTLENREPYFVMLEIKQGDNKSSRDIAVLFDDISIQNFYYRDWTKNGMPYINDGEVYWSGFWFQFQYDAKKFVELYGGKGSWEEGYKEFCKQCNDRRNNIN